MRRLPPFRNSPFAFAVLALTLMVDLAVGAPSRAGAGQDVQRWLIVFQNESTLPASIEVARGLHLAAHDEAPTQIEFYTEYLDAERFPGPEHLERLAEIIAEKYGGVRFDVALAGGSDAFNFLLDHRRTIAPGVPIVFGAVNGKTVASRTLPPDVYGAVSEFDAVPTVNLALRLQPDARRIVVMTGLANFDRQWEQSAHASLGDTYAGREVDYVSGLSLDGFKAAARALSRDTVLLVLTILEDADGRKFMPRDAAAEIAAASGAPVYAVYSSYIGKGVVGAVTATFESIGRQMAEIARQVASGAPPSPRLVQSMTAPVVDWRALRHWGLSQDLLPSGADLEFYQPSVWERYRREIAAVILVLLLQTATIFGLIVTERRRHRVAAELAQERLELVRLSRASQLGALSGSFAHELNQPLTAILANAQVGLHLLQSDRPDQNSLREALSDIVDADKRAASIIAQLRQMMRKGEASCETVDLDETVRATIGLARSELIARQTKVNFTTGDGRVRVKANRVQLKQLILNLMMNAVEAMAEMPAPLRRIDIATRLGEDGFAELTVLDNGPGLSEEVRARVLEPFVTTKEEGLGLGLAICRSIVAAHGGTIEFAPTHGAGAQVVVRLPTA